MGNCEDDNFENRIRYDQPGTIRNEFYKENNYDIYSYYENSAARERAISKMHARAKYEANRSFKNRND